MKNKQIGFILIIALIGASAFALWYNFGGASGEPPLPPPPTDVDTDGDGVPDTSLSFSVFQALRVVHTDGTDHWYYPTSRTSLTPLTIYDKGPTTGKPISATQAYFYFNVNASKNVQQVVFNAGATVQIRNYGSKTLVLDLGSQSISQTVADPNLDEDVYVISSTITAQQMADIFNPVINSPYYWVIKLNDITATITFSDGTQVTVGATGVQADENQLWWQFWQVYSGETLSIVHGGVEWVWT